MVPRRRVAVLVALPVQRPLARARPRSRLAARAIEFPRIDTTAAPASARAPALDDCADGVALLHRIGTRSMHRAPVT
ncbi:hypothetical protein AURDEDRAFT_117004 [Auricularia subglabra TFB-10046 SS5]|nr:hypothetical protein AURDEDRAFT_117004 [Auricularia subglabra TFB-10046 SS5]